MSECDFVCTRISLYSFSVSVFFLFFFLSGIGTIGKGKQTGCLAILENKIGFGTTLEALLFFSFFLPPRYHDFADFGFVIVVFYCYFTGYDERSVCLEMVVFVFISVVSGTGA